MQLSLCKLGQEMFRPGLSLQPWSYSIFQLLAFSRDLKEGGTWKAKFKSLFLSLTFISYSKQMRESIWDESKSLALSLPLKVTRVINLYWRGSQILPWTLPDSPSHHLSAELLWIKRLSFIPPTDLLSDVSCLTVCWVIEIKRLLLESNRYLLLWMGWLYGSHVLVVYNCVAVKAG